MSNKCEWCAKKHQTDMQAGLCRTRCARKAHCKENGHIWLYRFYKGNEWCAEKCEYLDVIKLLRHCENCYESSAWVIIPGAEVAELWDRINKEAGK